MTQTAALDTRAIDTIVDILNTNEEWTSDELDAIAAVLDSVREHRTPSEWTPTGAPLAWRDGRYVAE